MEMLRVGGILAGQKLTMDNGFLSYRGAGGQSFRVLLSQIETITLDIAGPGKAELKVIGKGTVLASIVWPRPWAEKAQGWILEKMQKVSA